MRNSEITCCTQCVAMRLKFVLSSSAACLLGSCGYCYFSGTPWLFSYVLMPSMKRIDPERAHRVGVRLAANRLIPRERCKDDGVLKISVWGRSFSNPIGLAAGFDKHAEAFMGMLDMGFGFVEVGSITPFPQTGNPKPRVFRLEQDKAVINRYGFNSHGHKIAWDRLKEWKNMQSVKQQYGDKHVGVNLGKNKSSVDPVNDYVQGIECLGPFADYIVINVSSPNTPGLRDMQRREQLAQLLDRVLEKRELLSEKPPLLIKIAPDLTREGMEDIAAVIMGTKGAGVDGIIVSNTTVQRPNILCSKWKVETGGLSGKPLKHIATSVISEMYILTEGQVPIIGVGGVFTGKDAYEMITAGASLVQIYTSLSYEGPPIVRRIKNELADTLRKEGYSCVAGAVGAAHRKH